MMVSPIVMRVVAVRPDMRWNALLKSDVEANPACVDAEVRSQPCEIARTARSIRAHSR